VLGGLVVEAARRLDLPVRIRHPTPSINRRFDHRGGLPGFMPAGRSGSSFAH
jgi:hypothetical protein